MNNELINILDLNETAEMLNHFCNATSLHAKCVDINGNPVASSKSEQKFCELICRNKNGLKCCKESIVYGSKMSFQLGEPYIYSCHAGLIVCSAPLVFNEKLIGSIICGPVLLWEIDEEFIKDLKERTAKFNINTQLLIDYAKELKEIACVNMTSCAKLLSLTVSSLVKSRSEIISQRHKISAQQAEIAEFIMDRKKSDRVESVNKKKSSYPVEKEKELIYSMMVGDERNCRKILNEILTDIFCKNSGNLELMHAKIVELIAMISRGAVDSGTPSDDLNEVMLKFLKATAASKSFEDMCVYTASSLEDIIKLVKEHRMQSGVSQYLINAIRYMRANYKDELTLQKAAAAAFISPFYLSHIFRDEMNTTFSEYLIKIRMENAKKLLTSTNIKISAVAESVGFFDANYFTKVFIKAYGINPREFRKLS